MIYIETNSMESYTNFAIEQYFMTEKILPQERIFLFWRTTPTLMVGRYQNTLEEINAPYAREHGVQVARRMSGGGTVFTDLGGWQFSFITRGQADQIRFEEYLHPVIDALSSLGVKAEFNSRNDLVVDGRKISGNAQCMKNGYVLHHGTLLYDSDFELMVRCLTVDEEKIVSKGIKSVRERTTNIAEHMAKPVDPVVFKDLMVRHIMQGSDLRYELTQEDWQRINQIADEKFRPWEWNFGASPPFNIQRSGRFSGGKVDFRLDVEKGIIRHVTVYGDFFGASDVEDTFAVLVGCPYRKEDIRKALASRGDANGLYRITLAELLDCLID